MKFTQTWRWFGPDDPITLEQIRQTGTEGIVTALHHLPIGSVWAKDQILQRKEMIEKAGLRWSVVESIPVHDEIKRGVEEAERWIEAYKQSILNLGECGIETVCYNFMPVLDWTRTELNAPMPDGSTGLRFDEVALASFDIHILKRDGASAYYEDSLINKALQFTNRLTPDQTEKLTRTILAGLPGSEEGYTLDSFRKAIRRYDGISPENLRENLADFLQEIVPAAESVGVKLAIHPDDPPFSLFGLPRVVSSADDFQFILDAAPSESNGITFCTGSLAADSRNALPEILQKVAHRIHFLHLRNVKKEEGRSFHEADHLAGDVDMAQIMELLIREQIRRKRSGIENVDIPMRPDHGHRMLWDLEQDHRPGYTLAGRLRGLSELRGLEIGLRARSV